MRPKARALSTLFLSSLFLAGLLLATATAARAQQVGEGFGPGCTSDVAGERPLKECCPSRACAQTAQFRSKLVGAALPYRVVVPPSYTSPAESQQRYPVLYLLHGFGGHYTDWLSKTKLLQYASRYRFIIVTPEGNDGWYTDSATVPADKYETYILEELMTDVQHRYRTVESREGRAIAGLSMGGYGALKFGVKHPELFSFAASLSGALGAAVWTENDLRQFGTALPRSIMQTFGPAESQTRAANDLIKLLREFPAARLTSLPYFYLDCGTEDGLLSFSRALADLLRERKIPYEYRELPGQHNWAYWDSQVQEVLRVAAVKIPQSRSSSAVARLSSAPRPHFSRQPRQRFSRA
ncbi:MAG TPA: alpha/beta hydrolase family protein [Pyrinomonadaceae bacterium]|jgi:S-formylglutathione hydrolase FrmB